MTDGTCDHIFEVKDVVSATRQEVHGRRLKLFRNSDFEITDTVIKSLAYPENELMSFEHLDDIRMREGWVELCVKQRGFVDPKPTKYLCFCRRRTCQYSQADPVKQVSV